MSTAFGFSMKFQILEKLFYTRLNDFVIKYNILSEKLYGFRSNRTTSHALIEFVEKISNVIENKQYTVGVFLDLKKAFDKNETLWHKRGSSLLDK